MVIHLKLLGTWVTKNVHIRPAGLGPSEWPFPVNENTPIQIEFIADGGDLHARAQNRRATAHNRGGCAGYVTQAPIAVPEQPALAVASLAIQGFADLEALGGTRPLSPKALTVARCRNWSGIGWRS